MRRLTGQTRTCHRQSVTGAYRLQVRPRGVAAITAAITALAFVLCGLLAMQHEASVPHVRDAAGGYAHASRLAGHHEDGQSDIHGQRPADADPGECALLTTFHQAASHTSSPPVLVVAAAPLAALALAAPARLARSSDVYRLAPKTSPPAAV